MALPREWIDELLQQVDLRVVIEQTGYRLVGRGLNPGVECPVCHKDAEHCKVNVRKRLWHCFVCGASGNAIHWMRETQGRGFREAVAALAALANLPMPSEGDSARTREVLALAAEHYAQCDHPYLRERGISEAVIKEKGIGYAPGGTLRAAMAKRDVSVQELMDAGLCHEVQGKVVDRFFKRAVVPIVHGGKVVDLYGRSVETTRLPHLYAKGQEGVTFGWNDVRSPEVVVVESIINALTLHSHEITSVLAIGGARRFESGLVRALRARGCKGVILALDTGDVSGAGQAGTVEAIEVIGDELEPWVLQFPSGMDVNDVWQQSNSSELWQEIWENRISGARFKTVCALDRMNVEDIQWYMENNMRGRVVSREGDFNKL